MKDIHAYLNFDGNCREAMTFYAKCLGAELQIMTFGEAPFPSAPEHKNRVMHAKLSKGSAVLMASDTMPGMGKHVPGSNFSISVAPESLEETERIFSALSEKGQVTMALADAFWGARFGMLVDQFGIPWMVNFEKPKK